MKIAIADPPYLGRAERWYGISGEGNGHGLGKADEHPEAYLWDDPKTHKDMVHNLESNYDSWAIAMSVHSLSTYLKVIETDSRNGIRVCVWNKPSSFTSGSRIKNTWEPVIIKVHESRRGYGGGFRVNDLMTCPPPRKNFIGSKPPAWTAWVLELLGYQEGDTVEDLFPGSNAVSNALANRTLDFYGN